MWTLSQEERKSTIRLQAWAFLSQWEKLTGWTLPCGTGKTNQEEQNPPSCLRSRSSCYNKDLRTTARVHRTTEKEKWPYKTYSTHLKKHKSIYLTLDEHNEGEQSCLHVIQVPSSMRTYSYVRLLISLTRARMCNGWQRAWLCCPVKRSGWLSAWLNPSDQIFRWESLKRWARQSYLSKISFIFFNCVVTQKVKALKAAKLWSFCPLDMEDGVHQGQQQLTQNLLLTSWNRFGHWILSVSRRWTAAVQLPYSAQHLRGP